MSNLSTNGDAPFAASDLKVRIESGLATVTMSSTRATLRPKSLLHQLSHTIDELLESRETQSILLCGQKGIFLLGAEIPFFVRSIASGDLDRVLAFTARAHQLLNKIAGSMKPIVAWVRGRAMGAGLEIALACHQIVASPQAKFALPETSLGIYPGMGGTQRTPRRIGVGLAKWLIFTGCTIQAEQAGEIGLVDCVRDGDPARAATEFHANPGRKGNSKKYAALERFFLRWTVDQLTDPQFQAPTDPALVRALVDLRGNGPVALRMAESIIDTGIELPIEAAIELEYSGLREIFSTADAMSGLLSFGKGRPTFEGK